MVRLWTQEDALTHTCWHICIACVVYARYEDCLSIWDMLCEELPALLSLKAVVAWHAAAPQLEYGGQEVRPVETGGAMSCRHNKF